MYILLYRVLLISQFVAAGGVFFLLFFVSAPYGRHLREGWGTTIPAKIAWKVMESPSVILFAFWAFRNGTPQFPLPMIFFLLWEFHYIYRTFLFPEIMPGAEKPFPFLLVVFALLFNSMNSTINGLWVFHFSRAYTLSWLWDPRFILGGLLFLTGLTIHILSDAHLRALRQQKVQGDDGETHLDNDDRGYVVPRWGLFKLVVAPNYFGELVEWTGWAIMTWSLPGLAFAVFTAANLVPRAASHRRWYVQNFSDFPKERKRIIPFIY